MLVAIYEAGGELGTVLTRRRADLRRHAGEISFPGGRRDPGEPELVSTALREAHEEIGLPPGSVHVAGALPPTPTIATAHAAALNCGDDGGALLNMAAPVPVPVPVWGVWGVW